MLRAALGTSQTNQDVEKYCRKRGRTAKRFVLVLNPGKPLPYASAVQECGEGYIIVVKTSPPMIVFVLNRDL